MQLELCFDIQGAKNTLGNIGSQSTCDTMIFLIHSPTARLQCSTIPSKGILFKLYICEECGVSNYIKSRKNVLKQ